MIDSKELLDAARAGRKLAYAPYSRFAVGAALLGEDDKLYTGCNIENASYGLTCCAERTALYKAVSNGIHRFTALAIVGGPIDGSADKPCLPCGICRQALAEFCDDDMPIYFADGTHMTLEELLPKAFRLER